MALQSTTALATITLQAASSEVTFTGIPSTYRDLVLVTSGTFTGATEGYFYLDFNLDTGANYNRVDMYANGSAVSSGVYSNLIPITLRNTTSLNVTHILDYSATDKHKTVLTRNNTSADVFGLAGRWANTAAINSVRVRAFGAYSLSAGTTVSLYGRIA